MGQDSLDGMDMGFVLGYLCVTDISSISKLLDGGGCRRWQ